MKITTTKEMPKHLKILVYGDPGVGKTTFACSGQEVLGPALVANIEGGMLTMADVDLDITEQICKVSELNEVYEGMMMRKPGYEKYTTLVIDSGSELQNTLLREITGEADKVTLEQWGKITTRMKRWMQMFRDLPCHVIITALGRYTYTKNKDNSQGELLKAVPDFTPKVANSLMGYVDHVWCMSVVTDKTGTHRKLLTQPHGPYAAKTRYAPFAKAIGLVVTNPNIGTMYNTLKATIK